MSSIAELGDRLLCLFDGHCGLCNRAVQWLLRRDRRDRLRFAAFDSAQGSELLFRHGIGAPNAESVPGTVVVVCHAGSPAERVLARSEAVLALLRELPRPWPAVAAVLRWIPKPARDLSYRLIARWRYRIWGRLEICPLPTPEKRARFL